jgi:hypothetical protein
MRNRVVRTGSGSYQLRLRSNESQVLRELVSQLRDQLLASTDDPSVRRLFPPAYANDPERDAGYQVLTRDELLESRLEALQTVEDILDEDEIDHEQLTAWMQSLTALRLVLGTRLDIDDETHDVDPSHPHAPIFAVYDFLGWLLSQTVDALSDDLPQP